MRKENEEAKKDLKFNPADYDYIDDISFDGWCWEFIRRSYSYNLHLHSL